jgi:hypothetical protein
LAFEARDCLFLAGLTSSSELSDSAFTLLRLAGVGAFLGVGVAFFAGGAVGLGFVTVGLDSGSGEDSSISIGFWLSAGVDLRWELELTDSKCLEVDGLAFAAGLDVSKGQRRQSRVTNLVLYSQLRIPG